MSDATLETLVTAAGVVIALTIVATLIAVAYVSYVYRKVPNRRSVLFGMLVRADQIKAAAATWVGSTIAFRWLVLDGEPLPLWVTLTNAIAIEIILIPPIIHAVTIWLLRHDRVRVDGSPPPWHANATKEETDDVLRAGKGPEPARSSGLADPVAPEHSGPDAGPADEAR
jgi:hypothetical protein